MWPTLARHLVCPLHERLLGRSTFRYLRELRESQWLAPEELRELQRIKLRALLQHAGTHVPFYRRRFANAGIDPAAEDPFAALARLPLLDKPAIRSAREEMLWRAAPGGLHRHHTGGSTGEPLMFYIDRRRQAYDQAARARAHEWFDVRLGDRELYLWGSPIAIDRAEALKRVRDRLVNHRLLNAFAMSPGRMDSYLDALVRWRPACLFGYPSSIALLAAHARQTGHVSKAVTNGTKRPTRGRGLRAVFVTGEVCQPTDRRRIEDHFGVPVAVEYGSRDGGFIAHQCPVGQMHITAENVIVEVVVGDGSEAASTEGEIVVTHLDAYAMPFIRYRTGDLGRLMSGRCPCGRGLPLMDVVLGRTTDFLVLPDGTIRHALSIIYPLRELPGVRQFRVTQHENHDVTVAVVRDDLAEQITFESIARRVRPVVGDDVALRIDFVEWIPPVESGKHRYVISHAAPLSSDPVTAETTRG